MEKNKTTCYTFNKYELVLSHQEVQALIGPKETIHLRFYGLNIHPETKSRRNFFTFDVFFNVVKGNIEFEGFSSHILSISLEKLTSDMDDIIAFIHEIIDQEYLVGYLKEYGCNENLLEAFSREEFSIKPTDEYRKKVNKLRLETLF